MCLCVCLCGLGVCLWEAAGFICRLESKNMSDTVWWCPLWHMRGGVSANIVVSDEEGFVCDPSASRATHIHTQSYIHTGKETHTTCQTSACTDKAANTLHSQTVCLLNSKGGLISLALPYLPSPPAPVFSFPLISSSFFSSFTPLYTSTYWLGFSLILLCLFSSFCLSHLAIFSVCFPPLSHSTLSFVPLTHPSPSLFVSVSPRATVCNPSFPSRQTRRATETNRRQRGSWKKRRQREADT